MKNKYHWQLFAMACCLTFGALAVPGCTAAGTKTTTTTTETTNAGPASDTHSTTVTTREDEETGARPHGIIGGIFYTIGQVLIFPFKVIGSLF